MRDKWRRLRMIKVDWKDILEDGGRAQVFA